VHQTDDEKNIRIKLILSKNSENVSENSVWNFGGALRRSPVGGFACGFTLFLTSLCFWCVHPNPTIRESKTANEVISR
jgi:hypothetical protein